MALITPMLKPERDESSNRRTSASCCSELKGLKAQNLRIGGFRSRYTAYTTSRQTLQNVKIQNILIILMVLILAGCSTSYGRMGIMGGVTSKKLEDGVHVVIARGNSYTSFERVQQIALLKSAEVTLENGYDYFLLVSDTPKALEAYKKGKLRQYALATGTQEPSKVSTIKQGRQQWIYNAHSGLSLPVGPKSGGSILVVMLKAGHPDAKRAISAKATVAKLRPVLVPKDYRNKTATQKKT